MAKDDFSDELLMRFVDGEVDNSASGRIETAMRNDSDLADRVAGFAETRALAKDALEPALSEPVPAALVRSVEDMIEQRRRDRKQPDTHNKPDTHYKVVALQPHRLPPILAQRWAIPLAASLAAILAGMGGFWLGVENGAQPQGLALGTIGNSALSDALATVPSGGEKQIAELGKLRVLASFHDGSGGLCRELELNPPQGSAQAFVSCRKDGAWTTTFAVAVAADDDSYAPASSAEALDAYLSSINALPPLTTAAERQALGSLK